MGIFPAVQGQQTPQSLNFEPIQNFTVVQSKMKELECSQDFPH